MEKINVCDSKFISIYEIKIKIEIVSELNNF